MIYTIPRYPVHLIDFVSAANGRRVTIRPMLPQDIKLQREFFRSLSARARYYRFMASFNELPDGVAERLGKIDYSSHLALLAEVFEDRSETMVGEARYVIDCAPIRSTTTKRCADLPPAAVTRSGRTARMPGWSNWISG